MDMLWGQRDPFGTGYAQVDLIITIGCLAEQLSR